MMSIFTIARQVGGKIAIVGAYAPAQPDLDTRFRRDVEHLLWQVQRGGCRWQRPGWTADRGQSLASETDVGAITPAVRGGSVAASHVYQSVGTDRSAEAEQTVTHV